MCTKDKKIVLDLAQPSPGAVCPDRRERSSKRSIELVHLSVSTDSRMVLRYPATPKQAGVPTITCTGIDLHVKSPSGETESAQPGDPLQAFGSIQQ